MGLFILPGNKKSISKIRHKATGQSQYGQPNMFSLGTPLDYHGAVENLIPREPKKLNELYRKIYMYDSVCGSTIDLMSQLPYSDYSLTGVDDLAVLDVFQQSLEHLNILNLLPQMSVEFLTIGYLVSTLVFNAEQGLFTDLIVQDPDYCEMEYIPLHGFDPKIDLKIPQEFRKFLMSKDERDEIAKSTLSEELVTKLLSGKVKLDPNSTLYLSRKTHPKDTGTSYLSRIIPYYILEQILLEGTIQGAQRRQRAIMHITCLTGDTLVSVNGGLKRIDEICFKENMKPDTFKKVNFETKGKDGEIVKATKWWYRGEKEVVKVKTKSGNYIKATNDHKVLVLTNGPDLVWKEIKDLQIGDYLCIDSNNLLNDKIKKLNIQKTHWKKTPKLYNIPEIMTPELAYLVGLILSDGTLRSNGSIIISNTEKVLLKKAKKYFKNIFNADGKISKLKSEGFTKIFGKTCCRKNLYILQINSKFIVDILNQIGLKNNSSLNISNKKIKISKKKEIPWSILQADMESKYSFIAGYIDGDGSIFNHNSSVEIVISSYSKKILNQFKIMLLDMGINSTISYPKLFVTRYDGTVYYENIKKYINHPNKKFEITGDLYFDKTRGIPTSFIKEIINERYYGRVKERRQYIFINDKGEKIYPEYWGMISDVILRNRDNKLIYQNFGNKKYKDLMSNIKEISENLYVKIEKLVEIGYIFEPITSIKKLKDKQSVYDLTIDEKYEPAFVANGVVVHNCGSDEWEPTESELEQLIEMFVSADQDPIGAVVATKRDVDVNDVRNGGDFWKVTDEWDALTNAKMRALGINESFLCTKKGSLISTENGLMKIENIYPEWNSLKKNEYKEINLKVKGFKGKTTANKFWYRGYDHTYSINTELGYNADVTEDHRFMVLGYGLEQEWVKCKDLKEDVYLFIDTIGNYIHGHKKLELNLVNLNLPAYAKEVNIPDFMTTSLAYLIGLIFTDGSIDDNRIRFSNVALEVLNKFEKLVYTIFGNDIHISKSIQANTGKEYNINGIKGISKDDTHTYEINSKQICYMMEQLGVKPIVPKSFKKRNGVKYRWIFSELPWCILQADRDSQYAFLAGFIDGDGSIYKDGQINFYQKSEKVIKQLQVLLADLGVTSFIMEDYKNRLSVNRSEGYYLYEKVSPYLMYTNKNCYTIKEAIPRTFGIPIEPIRQFIKDRHIGRLQNNGELFKNDKGEVILIKKWAGKYNQFLGNVVGECKQENKLLLYCNYENGKYDDMLKDLKLISKKLYKNLVTLFKLKYKFDKFSYKKKMPKEHLFDLSINDRYNAYFLNAFISHNSGDATYNCIPGDTLIPTIEKGIIRIDEMCDKQKGKLQDVKLSIGTPYGIEKNGKWLYNGKAPVTKITVQKGNEVECTPKHPMLVLYNNELMEIKTKDLQIGDYLCISKKKCVRNKRLDISKSFKEINHRRICRLPKYMTPDLAYISGLLMAEGSLSNNNVSFGNSDKSLITTYTKITKELFGIEPSFYTRKIKGTKVKVNYRTGYRNSNFYDAYFSCNRVINFFNNIGVNGLSLEKEVPWSILQADGESQLAYIAGYIEGDGHISKREIRIHSYSYKNLQQMQIMLNSHGYISKLNWSQHAIYIAGEDAQNLYKEIDKYLISKKANLTGESQDYGIPNIYTKEFFKSRYVGYSFKNRSIKWKNDSGNIIEIKGRKPVVYGNMFSMRYYRKGTYDKLLNYVKQISEKEYNKLVFLFNSEIQFTPITKLEDMGIKDVYDLAMLNNTHHFFNANGISLRNTMEAALSVFIETLKAFRDYMTHKIFYFKIFPLLSQVHRFVKRKQSELDHRIRITGTGVGNMIPYHDLIIPELQWHKQLQPAYDESYMGILSTLEEKGIPIPSRVWAASGGFSLDKLLDNLTEDIESKKRIADYKKELKEITGGGEEGGEEEAGWGVGLDRKPRKRKLVKREKVIGKTDALLAKAIEKAVTKINDKKGNTDISLMGKANKLKGK